MSVPDTVMPVPVKDRLTERKSALIKISSRETYGICPHFDRQSFLSAHYETKEQISVLHPVIG